ncbi:Ribosomal protein L4 [Candidatus Korarchaeum cryptofilum OPF8]|uniref:Large ribosomal subunit protein uL4 n=2 Tax=Candidatus Korarchaeum cryptofilum TaxID=498846 RepID=B1L705_KORCO|nr:Ribosomal protein L4 [Candidatus Korarchaeum cryptofilum OPF8]
MNPMEVPVYNLNGEVIGRIELPPLFELDVRQDIIRRVYLSQLTARIQPQGRDPLAGLRTSAESLGVGHGIARVPRVKGRGYPAAGRAARAVMAVGGAKTKAPRSWKVVWERVNKKERRLAIGSAIAATSHPELVGARHRIPEGIALPIVVSDDIESIAKTSDLHKLLKKLGLEEELERCKRRFGKIRAGRGKMRGRVRQRARGPLIIYSREDSPLKLASRNIPGVDAVSLRNLSVMHLAPGGKPGRLTIWSESSIRALEEVRVIV